MDSQSVKNTDSADSKGYDAGKKVSGIKRHIAVDTQGLPHAIPVTTANVTDRAGALAMFDENRADLSQVQKVLVDGGYTGKPSAAAVQSRLGAAVEVVKRNELHTFVVLPKRWVVERSFAWLEKCRRLWKNCERKLNTSLQMAVLAFMVLISKDRRQALRFVVCSNPITAAPAINARANVSTEDVHATASNPLSWDAVCSVSPDPMMGHACPIRSVAGSMYFSNRNRTWPIS